MPSPLFNLTSLVRGLFLGALLCCRLRQSTRNGYSTCYSSKQHDLHWPSAILFVALKVLPIVYSMARGFPSSHSLLSNPTLAGWATCLVSGTSPGPPPVSHWSKPPFCWSDLSSFVSMKKINFSPGLSSPSSRSTSLTYLFEFDCAGIRSLERGCESDSWSSR
jgi:hypothetical protein